MPKQPSSQQHVLERRSSLLAQKIRSRIDDTVQALQASNGRIPYRTKLSQGDALDWWAKHRHDALGEQALNGLDPLAVARLDNALTARLQESQNAGLPIESTPAAPPPNPFGNEESV